MKTEEMEKRLKRIKKLEELIEDAKVFLERMNSEDFAEISIYVYTGKGSKGMAQETESTLQNFLRDYLKIMLPAAIKQYKEEIEGLEQ